MATALENCAHKLEVKKFQFFKIAAKWNDN